LKLFATPSILPFSKVSNLLLSVISIQVLPNALISLPDPLPQVFSVVCSAGRHLVLFLYWYSPRDRFD
jgi:hypothetical protein